MPLKGHCPKDTTGDAQVFLGGGILAPEVKLAALTELQLKVQPL